MGLTVGVVQADMGVGMVGPAGGVGLLEVAVGFVGMAAEEVPGSSALGQGWARLACQRWMLYWRTKVDRTWVPASWVRLGRVWKVVWRVRVSLAPPKYAPVRERRRGRPCPASLVSTDWPRVHLRGVA
jgi:hypothetical protein